MTRVRSEEDTHGAMNSAPQSQFASNRMDATSAAVVRELVRRASLRDPPSAASRPTSAGPLEGRAQRRGERFTTYEELRHATQEAALYEWNVGPGRPNWSLQILRCYSPEPLDLGGLLYLSAPQRQALADHVERDHRYVAVERESITAMRQLHGWLKRARATLSKLRDDDGTVGPGTVAIRRVLDPTLEIEQLADSFAGPGGTLARKDRARSNLIHDIPRLLRREASAREIVCASLLFGLFPKLKQDKAWLRGQGRTISEVFDAESKLIEKARARS